MQNTTQIGETTRLMHNPKAKALERVEKECKWCKEVALIPANYRLCDKCHIAMEKERLRRARIYKQNFRAKAKAAKASTGSGISPDITKESTNTVGASQNGSFTTNSEANSIASESSADDNNEVSSKPLANTSSRMSPRPCAHCQVLIDHPVTYNQKYCKNEECQEARQAAALAADKEKKKEQYHLKQALKLKEVQDKTLFILKCYKNKDMEAIKNFTQVEKTNALLAYVAQLNAEEYDEILLDVCAENTEESVESVVEDEDVVPIEDVE